MKTYTQRGPLLVTHQGLSGPGVLKLSAFAARVMAVTRWSFNVEVNWIPDVTPKELLEHFMVTKEEEPNKAVGKVFPKLNLAMDEESEERRV